MPSFARAGSTRFGPGQLTWLLIVSFGLTVASFLAATVVADLISRGVAGSATGITENSIPSVLHVSRARTEIRHLSVLLHDYMDQLSVGEDADPILFQIGEARQGIDREWKIYQTLPIDPGERELWDTVESDFREMDDGINRLLKLAQAHDLKGAHRVMHDDVRPTIERVDGGLFAAVELNAQRAVEQGEKIAHLRRRSLFWLLLLDGLSVLFAIIAAFAVGRVVQRYAAAAEVRVSELQHFAGRVAHDIRSPLASVGLALDFSRRSEQIDPKTRTMLERGSRTLQRVGQLVDGLLIFARAGVPPDARARADTSEIIQDVVQALKPAADEKEVELRVDISDQCVAACHPGVLTSIVSNLIGNAIKFMGDAAVRQIEVRVRAKGDLVRLEVQDTGPGIPSELQGRIFDPHVRAAGTGVPGLGLGLATVSRLAEAHGGAVGVESKVGEGSLFWVELPNAVG